MAIMRGAGAMYIITWASSIMWWLRLTWMDAMMHPRNWWRGWWFDQTWGEVNLCKMLRIQSFNSFPFLSLNLCPPSSPLFLPRSGERAPWLGLRVCESVCVCVWVYWLGTLFKGIPLCFCVLSCPYLWGGQELFRVKWTLECVICWWVIHWLNVLGKKYGPYPCGQPKG